MMRKLVMILLATVSMSSLAEEKTFKEIAEGLSGEVQSARVSSGIVRSIDLDSRTAVIGGYKYWFGPAFSEYPLKISLLSYAGGGSLELVEPGMKVEVTFGDTGDARIAMILRQLPDDADVDH